MAEQASTACVVGAGIIGSWAALHLREAGVPVTLVEQFPLPHDRGSSHGASRAFRFLGDEPLDRLDYSLERWIGLERISGECLFLQTGLLNFGLPGDAYLERYLAVLEGAGRACEWLDSGEIAERYPVLRYPSEWGAAWDPGGGILFADRCLAAVQARFRALGGEIVTARVDAIEPVHGGTRLRINGQGEFRKVQFEHVVVCAGPWTGMLLEDLAPHLACLRIPVTYWRDPGGLHSVSNGFPILFNARLTGVYGLPACEAHGHVKVLFHGGPESLPGAGDGTSLDAYVEKVSAYVQRYLPHLDHRRPARMETCRYTMTRDNEPIMDRVTEHLVVGCGYSGSGFKHAPASGKALAALALGLEGELPAGFHQGRYTLARF